MAHLIVKDGSLRGLRFDVDSGEVTIGREHTIILLEDDGEVSRSHAVVRATDDGVEVEDLGSTNGTFVNEKRISEAARLSSGDIVRVGQTRFDVEIEEDPNKTIVSGVLVPPTQQHSTPIPPPAHSSPDPEAELPDELAVEPQSESHVDELPLPTARPVEEAEAAPDPAMRDETSELPGRGKVGGGEAQRASTRKGFIAVAGVLLFGLVAYGIYTLVADGAPTRADFVTSVNDVCRDRMPRVGGLNGDRARNTERAAAVISDMTLQIEELEAPEGDTKEIDRFLSTFERVRDALENLNVSQRANNNRRAQEAERKVERFVDRFENASKNLGTEQCTFDR